MFSFADIAQYAKVRRNLDVLKIKCREFEKDDIEQFASRLALLNKSWGYKLSTCCETVDLKRYGIEHGSCIDTNLLSKYFTHDADLWLIWLMR